MAILPEYRSRTQSLLNKTRVNHLNQAVLNLTPRPFFASIAFVKSLLQAFFTNLFALYLLNLYVPGIAFFGGIKTFFLASLALTFINLFLKPLMRLFFLPLNLLTLGLFFWLVDALGLYLLTLIVPQIKILAWDFPGATYQGFIIPSLHFSFLGTLVLTAFALSFFTSFLNWLTK